MLPKERSYQMSRKCACLCFWVYGQCIYQGLPICHAPRLHFPVSNETPVDRQEFPPYEQCLCLLLCLLSIFLGISRQCFFQGVFIGHPPKPAFPQSFPRNGTTKRREMGESRVYIFEGVLQVTSLRFVVPFSRPTQQRTTDTCTQYMWTYGHTQQPHI